MVGKGDEPKASAEGVGVGLQEFGDGVAGFFFVCAGVIGESIGADDDGIAFFESHFKEVKFEFAGDDFLSFVFAESADAAGDEATTAEFLKCAHILSDLHLCGFVVVIDGDLFDVVFGFEVSARVTEVGHREVIAIEEGDDAGGSHDVFDVAFDAFVALVDFLSDGVVCGFEDGSDDFLSLLGCGGGIDEGLFGELIPASSSGLDDE